ncbi:MAG: hypothetical protein A2Y38_23035 [Spirochaetes bacterium GWB1_59_5]|nr:MAG: hypothetical protein A2Y38_23035 [Spirochaetes bacterium GWB1_59_5]
MRIIRVFLAVLHIFVGIGAVAGGLAAILNPVAPMGLAAKSIPGFPFDSFLIPGIILFGIVGLGNLAATVPVLLKRRWLGYSSGVLGCALMGWIVIQCVMLGSVVALHLIFFALGAAIACLALAALTVEGLWPGTWVADFLTSAVPRKTD